ncbi:MAG: hypothetical protein V9G19_14765 [Tetrasphaera sp.]
MVVNAGSSSLKYQFVDADSGAVAAKGLIEQIGEPNGRLRHTGRGVELRPRKADPG